MSTAETPATAPLTIAGNPTPAEVAAVMAVLSAASGAAEAARDPRRASRWADPQRNMRRSERPRPGAWVASTWRKN